jgi:predicted RNA binding protein YcfA (HicA-like mRNA interferase family)
MTKTDKLLDKARINPAGLGLDEFETLLGRLGWRKERQSGGPPRGSHRIYIAPGGQRLSIQPRGAQAKAYQVRQFPEIHDEQ